MPESSSALLLQNNVFIGCHCFAYRRFDTELVKFIKNFNDTFQVGHKIVDKARYVCRFGEKKIAEIINQRFSRVVRQRVKKSTEHRNISKIALAPLKQTS